MTELMEEMKPELISAMSKARRNLVNFRRIALVSGGQDVAPAQFHFQWSDEILDGSGHIAFEAFRESAKDQYLNRSFPLYALTFPDISRSYILIIRANDDLAEKNIKAISDEFFSNPLISSRVKRIIKRSAKTLSVIVYDDDGNDVNVIIEGYGKGSPIRGLATSDRRPDVAIINDIQGTEDAQSDAIMRKDWDWFLSDVMFLGKNTRIFAIGNNLGERCVMEQIDEHREELGFKFFRIGIMDQDGPTWPSNFPMEKIVAEREAYRKMGRLDVWLKERMCQSTSEETRTFQKGGRRNFDMSRFMAIKDSCNGLAMLDPASSPNPESCYRAITVKFTDPDNNWFVTDCKFGRWDVIQLIDNIFDTLRQWKVKRLGVEKGMLKDWLETLLLEEMKKRNFFFEIISIEHAKNGTKLERIKALSPRWKSGQILLPEGAEWVTEMLSELYGVTKDAIKSKFIDLVDSLAMHMQVDDRPSSQAECRQPNYSFRRGR